MHIFFLNIVIWSYWVFAQAPFSMLTGDKILWESSPKGTKKFKAFSLKIKLTKRETSNGSCMDSENLTYDACIDSYMKKKFHPVFGCNVPWMTTDAQCSGQIKKSAKRNYASGFLQYVLMRSLGGYTYQPKECLLPCSQVSAHSTLTQSGNFEYDSLIIQLDTDVIVEQIVLAYGFADLLVEVKYYI